MSESLEEPRILPLEDLPEHSGRGPSARVDHRAVGDLGLEVFPTGSLLGERGVHKSVTDKANRQTDTQASSLVLRSVRVFGGLQDQMQPLFFEFLTFFVRVKNCNIGET